MVTEIGKRLTRVIMIKIKGARDKNKIKGSSTDESPQVSACCIFPSQRNNQS